MAIIITDGPLKLAQDGFALFIQVFDYLHSVALYFINLILVDLLKWNIDAELTGTIAYAIASIALGWAIAKSAKFTIKIILFVVLILGALIFIGPYFW